MYSEYCFHNLKILGFFKVFSIITVYELQDYTIKWREISNSTFIKAMYSFC